MSQQFGKVYWTEIRMLQILGQAALNFRMLYMKPDKSWVITKIGDDLFSLYTFEPEEKVMDITLDEYSEWLYE